MIEPTAEPAQGDPVRMDERTGFLLLLALGLTGLFFWLIKGFLLAVLLAAVLAALAHPLYQRLLRVLGGRKLPAAGVTVLVSLFLVVIPLLLFLGILVGEALETSSRAQAWLATSASLEEQLAADPDLQQLLP